MCVPVRYHASSETLESHWTPHTTLHIDFCVALVSDLRSHQKPSFTKTECHQKECSTI